MKKHTKAATILLLGMALAAAIYLGVYQNRQSQGSPSAVESAAPSDSVSSKTQSAPESKAKTQIITDQAGRTLALPAEIKTVYSVSPTGTMLMYTFDDKMVAGLNVVLSNEEKAYLTEYYQNLSLLGGWYGKGNQGNVEEIMKSAPDIILSSGTDQTSVDTAKQFQRQMGIPVILVKSDLIDLADTYRFLGKLFNKEARGEALAAYTEETVKYAKEIADRIPDAERIRVYYAEEQDGLHTDPSGSSHSRLIDLCGGINVADCDITPGYGRTAVSIEQVMSWDPQLIICGTDKGSADSGSYNTILNDGKWSEIKAVRDKLVFQTPFQPQNWFDRPPSVNTIIGIKWIQSLLYPQYVDYNIREEAKKFYKLFYHIELSDKDVDIITKYALRD